MTDEHAGHVMPPAKPDERRDGLRARVGRLEELRVEQTLLDRARERELAEQRRHDGEAQRLMDTNPQGHIEMMRMLQEHKALVRDLPPEVLERQAELYKEIVRVQEAAPHEPLAEPGPMMTGHLLMERWSQIVLLPLGAWLIASPSALAYRSAALAWSDIVSGAVVIVLAALTLARRAWAPWVNAFVGLWVMFAPLTFWAPDAAAYANDTLVGALITAFAILVPMRTTMQGPDVPPEWSYSPSTWLQRAPTIALAFVSFFMARYMAAFQLGHIGWAWDPFFGNGTVRILTSDVSKAFPISDAGLGAYTYMIEILSGLMGDARRWRTMPWMVALFGIAVVPLGIISVVLIVLQPLAVGAWCTLCLASALFMLIMVVLSLDEVIAMIQFLIQTRRGGRSVWRAFWAGGNIPERIEDLGLARRNTGRWRELFWGATLPWNLVLSALLGTWLMASPDLFNITGGAADSDHLLGALVVVTAVLALAEVARAVRLLNVPLALAIIAAPWLLGDASLAARLNDLIAGALIIGLSLPRGRISNRYGGWNPYIV
ncbi:MAG: SPW repeat domain-containing protein [bacterium]